MRRLSRSRLMLFLAVLGPGIITSAADNDAGGIMTCTIAGARYHYNLLWVVAIITIMLALVQEMSARMGVVTQKGFGELIRENFGVKWTMFALGTLLIANLATTVAEFAGIAAALSIFGISKYITVPIAAIIIWLLVVKGSFKTVERVFLSFTLIYVTYIISGILARPDWSQVFHATTTPTLQAQPAFLFLTIAVIGTTITPWMQFFLQATIVDKGVRVEDYGYQKLDVYIGSLLTGLISFFIIVAAATMIYDGHGGPVILNNATEAAEALKPVAKGYAALLFGAGLFGASFLAAGVLPLSTAYTYSEAFGWEVGVSRNLNEAPIFYGVYTFCIIFGATIVLLPGTHLINAMINAQAVNGILLPVILIFMVNLLNKKDVMGSYINSKFYNIITWFLAIVLIILTIAWLAGLVLGYS